MSFRTLVKPSFLSSRIPLVHTVWQQASKRYATVDGKVSLERARAILSNPPRSRRGNMFDYRRMYLWELYQEVFSKRGVFMVQVTGIPSKEYDAFQSELLKMGYQSTFVRNALFTAAARHYCKENPTDSNLPSSSDLDKMTHMLVGHTCVIFTDKPSQEANTAVLLKDVHSALSKQHHRMMLVGAKLDSMFLSADQVQHVLKAIPGGIEAVHAELLGVLESNSRQVIGVVEKGRRRLVDVLANHTHTQESS